VRKLEGKKVGKRRESEKFEVGGQRSEIRRTEVGRLGGRKVRK